MYVVLRLFFEVQVFAAIGYSVAYVFHIASCGFLFRFEEFAPYSCFVGNCGFIVDRRGPGGMGFPEGRTWCGTIPKPVEVRTGGGGGGDDGGGGG